MSKYLKHILFVNTKISVAISVVMSSGLLAWELADFHAGLKMRDEKLPLLNIRFYNRRNWPEKKREEWLRDEMQMLQLSRAKRARLAEEARNFKP